MSSRDEQWWDLQAGELVLGTLDEHELELFDSIRKRDPEFQQRVIWWQEQFSALDRSAPAIEPDPAIWRKIEAQLGFPAQQVDLASLEEPDALSTESILDQTVELEQVQDAFQLDDRFDDVSEDTDQPGIINQTKHEAQGTTTQASSADSTVVDEVAAPDANTTSNKVSGVNIWRDLTLLATAASIILAIIAWNANLTTQSQSVPTTVAESASGISLLLDAEKQAIWTVHTLNKPGELQVSTLRDSNPGTDGSYQLWLVKSDDSGVIPMGQLPTKQGEKLTVSMPTGADSVVDSSIGAKAFAVSLEPIDGDVSGGPTGPVLFQGEYVEQKSVDNI